MKKLFTIITLLSISLMSCDKPQLDEIDIIEKQMSVKGWNVTKFIDNNNKHSLTSKTTKVDYTLEVRGSQTLIFSENGHDYYEAKIWEGDIEGEHTILGSVVYSVVTFSDDNTTWMNATINMNDKDGNETKTIHIEPTQSFEIVYIQ